MDVTVEVLGDETHEVTVEDGTYADLLRAVDLHPQAATVLVDGTPVPNDRSIDRTAVQVLRLIRGG